MKIRFSDFELDDQRYVLKRAGRPLSLRPKVFDLLVHLAAHRERVVRREELVQALWGTTQVGAGSLSGLVNELRAALGEDGRSVSSIRTVHARGYQFVAQVWGEEAATASRTIGDPVELIERVASTGAIGVVVEVGGSVGEVEAVAPDDLSQVAGAIRAAAEDSGFSVVEVSAPDETRELSIRFAGDLIRALARGRGPESVGKALPLPARAWFASGRTVAVAGGVAPTRAGPPGGFSAAAGMLDGLSRERPVAIFVDNLEIAGVSFARDLANLMKRLGDAPVLCVVLTLSNHSPGPWRRVLESEAGFERWRGRMTSELVRDDGRYGAGLAVLPSQLADALVAHAEGDVARVTRWIEGITTEVGHRRLLRVSPAAPSMPSVGKNER